ENVIVKEEVDTDNDAVDINSKHRVGSQAEPNSTNKNQPSDVVVRSESDSECQCSHQDGQIVIKEKVDATTNPVDVNTVEPRPDPQSNSDPSNRGPHAIEPLKNEVEDSVCCCTDHDCVPVIKEDVNHVGELEIVNSMPPTDHG